MTQLHISGTSPEETEVVIPSIGSSSEGVITPPHSDAEAPASKETQVLT